MKVVMLILHIACVILFGICAVNATNMTTSILYTISVAMWSICIGMDIHQLIDDIDW